MSDQRQLQRPAADYLAGDLDPAERAALEHALAGDPELTEELAFWERMGPALRAHGRHPEARPPGAGILAVARRRAADEETSARQRSSPAAWFGWIVAAAATILLAINLVDAPELPSSDGVTIAYAEDGSAQVLPRSVAELLPALHRRDTVVEPSLVLDGEVQRQRRPWLGVWTQPIELKGFDRSRGLRVVRVAADGPVARAGVVPGDILLDLAGCPLGTRYCLGHAFKDGRLGPGDRAGLTFWQASSGAERRVLVTLGCCLE